MSPSQIVQAFKKTAVSDVITIVNDPSRYSLGGAGGIAGGNKYLNNNIIYKFSNESAKPAQDSLFAQSNAVRRAGTGVPVLYNHLLCFSAQNAMKVAAHELRALNMVLDANIFGLNVPLFAVIDYNGWRIIAEVCPLLVHLSRIIVVSRTVGHAGLHPDSA